ncbi:MAG TPA: allantoinase AllB [Pyrinomonadaceae bacterium]|jgi:allantoinase
MTTTADFVIRARRVVMPAGVAPAAVQVRGGRIGAVGEFADVPAGSELIEVDDEALLLPGLVDTHVHINEPGRTEWEGFASATRAAAAGGVTTLVEMPLNSVPATTTRAALAAKLDAARGQLRVDVAFWGGVVPGNAAELEGLRADGVVGFKCFLVPSGVDEFPHVTEDDLRAVMPLLARMDVPLIVHAEAPAPIDAAVETVTRADADPRRYATFLVSRPEAAEEEAVALMIRLCRETGARVHIVHHSAASALPLLAAAKAEGLPFTAETCPHYLVFAAEDVPDGATEYKCCPPVRGRANREALWRALEDGTLDFVVSDHSPCPPVMKRRDVGDFMQAWGGISSLQLRLSVMWTQARARGHSIEQLCAWLAAAPARLVGLEARKGAIRPGCDADLCVFHPEAVTRVAPDVLQHRHKLTPYAGHVLRGAVAATYLRGVKIYERGAFLHEAAGAPLLAGGAA